MSTRKERARGAVKVRQSLEDAYYDSMEPYLEKFLEEVRVLAENALDAPLLLAAGQRSARRPGRPVSDPFAYTSVRSRWYAAIREMVEYGTAVDTDHLIQLMRESDLPVVAYSKVKDILTKAESEEWTAYATKKALSAELITKRGKGEGVDTYRTRIRRMARTASTQNYNIAVLKDLLGEGATGKTWVSLEDDRVRPAHAHASGQTVGINDPFTVGGYQMAYPGDPTAPLELIANCRCVVIPAFAGESSEDFPTLEELLAEDLDSLDSSVDDYPEEELYASAANGLTEGKTMSRRVIRWAGPVAMEDERTGDGREVQGGALRWTTPLPLRSVHEDVGGHLGAIVVGTIETLERQDGGVIWGEGTFDTGSEEGLEAARLVAEGVKTGVSMDIDDVSFEVRYRVPEGSDNAMEATEGEEIVIEVVSGDEVMVTTDARMRAVTLVSIPAFDQARISIVSDEIVEDEGDTSDEEVIEEAEAIVAGATVLVAGASIPVEPPAVWFSDPSLAGPTPLTITKDGRVYGHLATWDVCHVASPAGEGVCVVAPHSVTGYARFHTGSVLTAEGTTLSAGKITMGTGHARPNASPRDTSAHYDNTGTAVADVRAGEDAYGIWVAGALRPTVTAEQVRTLRASPLSGDWRGVDGNLELHAALAVNVPGFPIPRPAGLIASGELSSLTASGVILPKPETPGLSASEVAHLKRILEKDRALTASALKTKVMKHSNTQRVHAFAQKLTKG